MPYKAEMAHKEISVSFKKADFRRIRKAAKVPKNRLAQSTI